jgi:hypothetical protein
MIFSPPEARGCRDCPLPWLPIAQSADLELELDRSPRICSLIFDLQRQLWNVAPDKLWPNHDIAILNRDSDVIRTVHPGSKQSWQDQVSQGEFTHHSVSAPVSDSFIPRPWDLVCLCRETSEQLPAAFSRYRTEDVQFALCTPVQRIR